tara:strand:- start:760 stop:1113 length:354 start_codon:yes stop_codon:yes gene_type:complete
MTFCVLLPFPMSVNTLYTNVKGRGRVTTGRYRDWQWEAALMLKKQTLRKFDKRVDIEIRCGKGRANQDISNLIKSVEDTLVKNDILIDDNKKYVRSVKASWDDDVAGCVVFIEECEE